MQNTLTQTLALLNLPGCGAATFWKLIDTFGSLSQVFDAQAGQLSGLLNTIAMAQFQEFQTRGFASKIGEEIEQELAHCDVLGVELITPSDPAYPELLTEIQRHPPLLYVLGDSDVLKLPQIAMVGSRKPTPSGQAIASEFAQELGASGFVITSGLAMGIDASAHRGALKGPRPSIAVLGSGLSCVYPQRHRSLAEEIVADGGALVSEFSLNATAKPAHFPQRNRIVSGLSVGTLVVEAALKSGSLITARHALQQNREVFAVPGSIRSAASRGCHAMIKSGATLVEHPKDIVRELSGALAYYRDMLPGADKNERSSECFAPKIERAVYSRDTEKVLACIDFELRPFEAIMHMTALASDVLSYHLLELELAGLIENTGMGYIKR